MDERKQTILEVTVEDYIQTAEPVGSKSLLERHDFGLSSATIRNELNELVKEGYLTHLHTSSGRVPTDRGYRHYVNQLLKKPQVLSRRKKVIDRQLALIGDNLHDLLADTGRVLSTIFDYSAIVMYPTIFQETLKAAHLVLVDINRILVVLLSSVGVAREFVCDFESQTDQDELSQVARLFTEKLGGKSFSISENLIADMVATLPQYRVLIHRLGQAIQVFSENLKEKQSMVVKGQSKMLRLPEFENIEYARRVMAVLDENRLLMQLLERSVSERNFRILIGQEDSGVDVLEGCSLVVQPCYFEDEFVGAIGVLGPTRMAYSNLIPVIQGVCTQVQEYVEQEEGLAE